MTSVCELNEDMCLLYFIVSFLFFFFFSSRRRHTRSDRDWSSDVCSSDLSDSQGKISSSASLVTVWLIRSSSLRSFALAIFFGSLLFSIRLTRALLKIGRASCRERV